MILNSYNNILVLALIRRRGIRTGRNHKQTYRTGKESNLCRFFNRSAVRTRRFSERYFEDRSQESDCPIGISPENLIIYNYEVRKLGYVRQEILEELIRLKKSNSFDLVFIPSLHDIHQDHTTIAQEGLRAFKNTTLLGYD